MCESKCSKDNDGKKERDDLWSVEIKNMELPWNVCIVDHLGNMKKTRKESLY